MLSGFDPEERAQLHCWSTRGQNHVLREVAYLAGMKVTAFVVRAALAEARKQLGNEEYDRILRSGDRGKLK